MSTQIALQKSYGIALLYVGLATAAVLNSYGNSPYHGSWVVAVLLITLPVNFISLGILYGDPNAYLQVAVVQTVAFVVTGLWIYTVFYHHRIKHER